MASRATKRRERFEAAEERVAGDRRFVDMGIVLHVVVGDEEHGRTLLPGKPRLRIVDSIPFGGILDTETQRIVGRSLSPVHWHCSVQQLPLILHAVEAEPEQRRAMLIGAMGGGKTEVLAKWAILGVLMLTGLGGLILMTSPTQERTRFPRVAVLENMHPSWGTWSEREQTLTFVNGVQMKFIGTKQNSKAQGSRVQGYNAARVGSDEIQDSEGDGGIDGVDADIEARGRSAPNGDFRRLATATEKGTPSWRTYRDRIKLSLDKVTGKAKWFISRIAGVLNPFVPASYWAEMAETMTDRDFRRRVGAEDLGPERMTYHTWSRDPGVTAMGLPRVGNLRPRPVGGHAPILRAKDVTHIVLRQKTGRPNQTVLVCFDPGELHNVNVYLKAYEIPGEVLPVWWVVGELTTDGTTAEQHAIATLADVAKRWACNVRKGADEIQVVADPYGKNLKKPDKDVYRVYGRIPHGGGVGIQIRAAEFSKDGTGTGWIDKDSRIDMVCTLLCNAAARVRLYVDCDERRKPCAPKLVDSLEMSQRNAMGEAEADRKDENDLSHWSAALGLGLWPWEKEAAKAVREGLAEQLRRERG